MLWVFSEGTLKKKTLKFMCFKFSSFDMVLLWSVFTPLIRVILFYCQQYMVVSRSAINIIIIKSIISHICTNQYYTNTHRSESEWKLNLKLQKKNCLNGKRAKINWWWKYYWYMNVIKNTLVFFVCGIFFFVLAITS